VVTLGQTDDAWRSFGHWHYPRLIGVLMLCGHAEAHAEREVQAVAERHVAERSIDPEALVAEALAATQPPARCPDPGPVGEVRAERAPLERAVADLAWDERLATVAGLALDDTSLGGGRPDRLASRLASHGVVVAGPAELAGLVLEEVGRGSPDPAPDLRDRLLASRRHRRIRRALVAGAAAAAVAVLVGVVAVVVRRGEPANGQVAADGIVQWVAVLDVGPDAFSLYPQVVAIGPAAGANVFTDRWACYQGFPDGTDPHRGEWFLALAAQDKAEFDALVARVGRTPLVEARVTGQCDPFLPTS
jgi:hypothetical protein